ncbi:cytochrome d ubiquinol oxidase subunit II [Anaerobacillus alkalidiazotrophicus]|uniref:Cytochrome d ubiquinol oxidase subunit II n=1 Tax=Anaerobacillus alkalidiazotrophicus TaxID=472963 RepID=A0A1S2M5R0_9BACI|nr:cytochrome d ubiquinol oxidase subunit II [Anaerobacillus alkalidiazotrophicus]OIJ20079.1 cytochrome d ubiquinol oxidase subunit II [Anaerobacillus alkalidiazotrophicus]
MDLNIIWFILLGVLIVGYAILDGFDLGIGTLFYTLGKTKEEKKTLINSIGPVWDGNEVWLLTAGGALFAAFPFVYATVFSGFYLAMLLVLFGLIFRAIAVEYYFKTEDDPKMQKLMGKLFFIGSLLPALLFGVAMGNIVVGIPMDSMQNYSGNFFQLLNPYSLLLGIVGLVGFLLQGSSYTILKTEGVIQQRAIRLTKLFSILIIGLWIVGTLTAQIYAPHMYTNYFNQPVLFLIPAATVACLIAIPMLIKIGHYGKLFFATSLVIATKIATLAGGMFPNLVFSSNIASNLTIYNASSTELTLKVMFIIALIGMPLVLLYTIYVYYVFRGKATSERHGY